MKGGPSNGSSFFGYGVAQHNRPLKALDPDYAKLDDRETSDLLAYAAELSKYIKYYNIENEEEGTWQPFFLSDISVINALIISTDIKSIEEEAYSHVSNFYKSEDVSVRLENYVNLRKLVVDIAAKFDFWYKAVVKLNLDEKRFESIIESELFNISIQKVRPYLHELVSNFEASKKIKFFDKTEDIQIENFHKFWDLETIDPVDVFFGKTDLEKITAGMLTLRLQFKHLFQTLSFSTNHFKRYFDNSLKYKDNHNPDISLFIGFLHVFKNIQSDFNQISERLLYYYYARTLKIKPIKGKSDYVHVHFELSDSVERYLLPEGTTLIGESEADGDDIYFETTTAIEITHAKIASLKTIFCSRLDNLDTSNYRLTSHIYAAPVANSRDGLGLRMENKYDTWPIFGEEQEYKPQDEVNMHNADIGWAFSSPVLHLNEGNRRISITLDFIPESTRILKRLVFDVYNKINDEKAPDDPVKIIQEVFYDRIFNQLDKSRNFKIYLSGNREWIEVDPNTISVKAVGEGDWVYNTELPAEENIKVLNKLEISFTLPVASPAVTNYHLDLDGPVFDTLDPVIKFVLNDKKQPYIYSFLQAVELKKVHIHVAVDRYRSLNVQDENGLIAENKNLYPFTLTPKRGTQSFIASPELFKKHLTAVSFKFDWDKMPETVEEFKQQYKNYQNPLHPAEVKIQIGAISNYELEMDYDESLIFPLFTTTEGDLEIHETTQLDHSEYNLTRDAIQLLQILPNYDLLDDFYLDDEVETGFFVFKIIEPRNALYSNIYQNEINEALNKNIANPQTQAKFPAEPVAPFAKNIQISYEAEAEFSVTFGDQDKPEKIFHIHPFGQETTYENGSPYRNYMLPKYNDDGYLFIGLEDVHAPETISLYFQLSSEDTKEQTLKTIPKIDWFYLSENQWIPFDDSKIIFDTTHGFTESGIIKFMLPFAITGPSTIVDSNLSWIVARVNGDVDRLNKAMFVAPHGVLAQWQYDADKAERIGKVLNQDSIKDFFQSNSEIKEVYQPFESFGGRKTETVKEFNNRVSELIRHKNRAVTHWDIERILLEEFPTVLQVKAISHLSDPLDKAAFKAQEYIYADEGENIEYNGIRHQEGLKVVVIPKQEAFKRIKTPKFSLYRLLEMQKFVASKTTPFMQIQLVNPQYEYVRIVANVKFIDNYNNGLTLNRLSDDINNYIAPWLNENKQDVKIGGTINENVLQNYIKGLSYVKFLTKFSILHILEEDGLFKIQDTADEQDIVSIIKARPWGVLLPDDHHEIEMINYEEEEEPISRVNSDEIIRFQNKVNILGDKKYIKIRNPRTEIQDSQESDDQTDFHITITL